MRIFDQLDIHEKEEAIEYCYIQVLELVYDGIIKTDGVDSSKVEQAISESDSFNEFVNNCFIASDENIKKVFFSLAEDMAADAEYPSKNSDGYYRKVIQL